MKVAELRYSSTTLKVTQLLSDPTLWSSLLSRINPITPSFLRLLRLVHVFSFDQSTDDQMWKPSSESFDINWNSGIVVDLYYCLILVAALHDRVPPTMTKLQTVNFPSDLNIWTMFSQVFYTLLLVSHIYPHRVYGMCMSKPQDKWCPVHARRVGRVQYN